MTEAVASNVERSRRTVSAPRASQTPLVRSCLLGSIFTLLTAVVVLWSSPAKAKDRPPTEGNQNATRITLVDGSQHEVADFSFVSPLLANLVSPGKTRWGDMEGLLLCLFSPIKEVRLGYLWRSVALDLVREISFGDYRRGDPPSDEKTGFDIIHLASGQKLAGRIPHSAADDTWLDGGSFAFCGTPIAAGGAPELCVRRERISSLRRAAHGAFEITGEDGSTHIVENMRFVRDESDREYRKHHKTIIDVVVDDHDSRLPLQLGDVLEMRFPARHGHPIRVALTSGEQLLAIGLHEHGGRQAELNMIYGTTQSGSVLFMMLQENRAWVTPKGHYYIDRIEFSWPGRKEAGSDSSPERATMQEGRE